MYFNTQLLDFCFTYRQHTRFDIFSGSKKKNNKL